MNSVERKLRIVLSGRMCHQRPFLVFCLWRFGNKFINAHLIWHSHLILRISAIQTNSSIILNRIISPRRCTLDCSIVIPKSSVCVMHRRTIFSMPTFELFWKWLPQLGWWHKLKGRKNNIGSLPDVPCILIDSGNDQLSTSEPLSIPRAGSDKDEEQHTLLYNEATLLALFAVTKFYPPIGGRVMELTRGNSSQPQLLFAS